MRWWCCSPSAAGATCGGAEPPGRRRPVRPLLGLPRGYHSLHFETCYYRAIEYCIDSGFARFEAGAQGEHKLSRGFLPVETHSLHWLAEPRFADAVAEYLIEEGEEIDRYRELLAEHSPFRREQP